MWHGDSRPALARCLGVSRAYRTRLHIGMGVAQRIRPGAGSGIPAGWLSLAVEGGVLDRLRIGLDPLEDRTSTCTRTCRTRQRCLRTDLALSGRMGCGLVHNLTFTLLICEITLSEDDCAGWHIGQLGAGLGTPGLEFHLPNRRRSMLRVGSQRWTWFPDGKWRVGLDEDGPWAPESILDWCWSRTTSFQSYRTLACS
jgi:hypothetical protein